MRFDCPIHGHSHVAYVSAEGKVYCPACIRTAAEATCKGLTEDPPEFPGTACPIIGRIRERTRSTESRKDLEVLRGLFTATRQWGRAWKRRAGELAMRNAELERELEKGR